MADEYVEIKDFDEVAEVLLGRPGLRSHLLTTSLVLAVAVALVWAALARFDLTVKATGVVRPTGEVARVQAALGGVTREVLVQDGDTVPAGAPLVRLDLASQRADAERNETTLGNRTAQIASLRASRETLLAQQTLEERLREGRVAAEEERIRILEERLAADVRLSELKLRHARSDEELKKKMFVAKIGSEQDWKEAIKARELAAEDERKAKDAQAKIDRTGLDLAKRELDVIRGTGKRQVEDKDRDIAALEGDIAEVKQRLSVAREELAKGEIVAPVAGTVQQLAVRRAGEVVTPGAQLAVIVPRGSRLVVEAVVAQQDIGQMKLGQTARFRFPAFPYQKYGALSGRVESIAADAEQIEVPGGGRPAVYRVKLSLEKAAFQYGGEELPIQIGMEVEASSVTGTETALTLLWRKVKGKFAP